LGTDFSGRVAADFLAAEVFFATTLAGADFFALLAVFGFVFLATIMGSRRTSGQ
jgi:hypothetical protein